MLGLPWIGTSHHVLRLRLFHGREGSGLRLRRGSHWYSLNRNWSLGHLTLFSFRYQYWPPLQLLLVVEPLLSPFRSSSLRLGDGERVFGPKVRREIVVWNFSRSLNFSQNFAKSLWNFAKISQNFARFFSTTRKTMFAKFQSFLRNSEKFWEIFAKFWEILRDFEKSFWRERWVQTQWNNANATGNGWLCKKMSP